MALSWDMLLDKLCAYLAANAAGGPLAYATTPRAVWRRSAVEADAAEPYSVLRQFGGVLPWVPQAKASIQCRTIGQAGDAAMVQAERLFNVLLDASGRPARNVVLAAAPNGIRINAVDFLQPPSFVELDERKRSHVVFNLEIRAVPLP